MKAIQVKEFGGPDVLRLVDVARPVPKGREVLVEVKAIGVNYADIARREGQYVIDTPLPFTPGAEIAGVVAEIGDQVENVKVGMPVVTLISSTGYAEYAIADEQSLIPIPNGIDYHQAVALPLQGLSAYHILKTMGRLERDESVLIHAAAGGVGTLAVQLANLFGARKIIATASTDEKLALAKELGATDVINYTNSDWEQQVLACTDGSGVDVALEMAGGEVFHKTLTCLSSFGRMVIYGVASGQPAKFSPSRLMEKNQSVIGFFLPQIMRKPQLFKQSLTDLLTYLQNGDLKLTIGGVYKLEEATTVHRLLQSRKTAGKLVLEP
ncbi:quinone oxidoreductase family protein [Desertibacillus haloalkaliphilus]|uniref:quinone oxidoreductase family protein n=1 Tax=Desertibacillus haloalkaliphilus TaxID=1328930 RepID=UPI001C2741B8|nr:quinone oxidoreductase [Desertibacillus haloalkaliphilus]MBU8905651.1 quinone oxidoreductase [Desertibacillus haloalkaliphilus]